MGRVKPIKSGWALAPEVTVGRKTCITTVMFNQILSIRSIFVALLALATLTPALAQAQLAHGSMDVHWNEGAKDCKTSSQPALQVHAYNPQTFILRESLCATFEAPFMYLLIGSAKALLIDTGDIADPNQMPLAKTVMQLLPGCRIHAVPFACSPHASAP